MILFHFNIANEKIIKNKFNTVGLGHANRSITLSNYFNENIIACINKNKFAKKYIIKKKINFIYEENLSKFLKNNYVKLIISDINYLNSKYINLYKQHKIFNVCLAPRGTFKYKANLSFQDVYFNNTLYFHRKYFKTIKKGPKYAVIRKEIFKIREKIDLSKMKHKKSIIICMGGADTYNMTSIAVSQLQNLSGDFKITIIIGELYEYEKKLIQVCKKLKCKFKIYKNPKNFGNILNSHTFAILGTGIITYEAMCLGIYTINIGHSRYHDFKGKEIAKAGAGYYLGNINSNQKIKKLCELILYLFNNKRTTLKTRKKAFAYVDGKGISRILYNIGNSSDIKINLNE